MGDFNSTCAVSGLPISVGDRVRWFFIYRMPERYQNDLVNRFSRWNPLTLPIRGTYDDYGKIENVEDDAITRIQLEWLSKTAQPLSSDTWEIEEFPHTMDSLVFACERQVLTIKHVYGDVLTAPFLVHEDIYQEAVRIGKAFGMASVFTSRLEPELRRDMKKCFEVFRLRSTDLSDALHSWHDLDSLFFREEQSLAMSLDLRTRDFPEDTWATLEEAFVNFRAFMWGMEQLRRDWMPSLRCDQNHAYKVHEQFHLKVIEVNQTKLRALEGDLEDEEEDCDESEDLGEEASV